MFSHGVIGALLFALVGVIYHRTHTRDLDLLGAMPIRRTLPFAAFAFCVASAASMGIPGFSGFAAEVTILIGTWKAYPPAVWITGAGMVLVAAFTLRALRQTFFSDEPVAATSDTSSHATFQPVTWAEKAGAVLLIATTLAIGVYPKLLLDRIMPAVETMRCLAPVK